MKAPKPQLKMPPTEDSAAKKVALHRQVLAALNGLRRPAAKAKAK